MPGWSGSAVWFLLCVYDFGCVGCMFVSGQQQGPRLERDREVNQSIAIGLESGVCGLECFDGLCYLDWEPGSSRDAATALGGLRDVCCKACLSM